MLVSNLEETLVGLWKAGKVEPRQELVHQLQSKECMLEFHLDMWFVHFQVLQQFMDDFPVYLDALHCWDVTFVCIREAGREH